MGTMGGPPARTTSGSAPSSPAHSVDSSGNLSGTSRAAVSAVKVVVRVRPLNSGELSRGEEEIVSVSSDQRSLQVGNRSFDFNACLSPDTTQPDVMIKCGVQRLLDSALHGYAASIFAYGQTGSGKTFSMSGREEVMHKQDWMGGTGEDGIMTRSLAHIFAKTGKAAPGAEYVVRCSYLEIYNEAIYDLLTGDHQTQLQERMETGRGFHVPGLKTVECFRLEDALAVVGTGTRNRHVGSHELNKDSSRSHSIMTVHIESHTDVGGVTVSKFGKVSFIDLAGSERLKQSKSDGTMAKETANINRSLFMLGKVIAMLSDGATSADRKHIPYRDSKLTKLLMDSLGESSLALMIACVSPSQAHAEETLNTLHYASRARNIINRPTASEDPTQALVSRLRKENETLRKENGFLKQKLGMTLEHQVTGLERLALDDVRAAGGGDADLQYNLQSNRGSPPGESPPRPVGGRGGGRGDRVRGGRGGRGGVSNGDTASAEPRSRRNLDDELMGSVPIDPQFEGMNKADLASRVERAEALLAHQMEECRQLEHENDDLRGSKQLLEMEHRTALEDAAELTSRLDSLEHAFLTEQDGTVEGFGFAEHGNYGSNSDFFATERGTASRKSSAGSIKPRDPRAAAIARVYGGPGLASLTAKPVPIEQRGDWQK
jgi:hypothetical protein